MIIGCTSPDTTFYNLCLHQFSVTASSRVLGTSNDFLERLARIIPTPSELARSCYADAKATLSSDPLQLVLCCVPWSLCLESDKEDSIMRTEIARPTVVQMLDLFNKNKSLILGHLTGQYQRQATFGYYTWHDARKRMVSHTK